MRLFFCADSLKLYLFFGFEGKQVNFRGLFVLISEGHKLLNQKLNIAGLHTGATASDL